MTCTCDVGPGKFEGEGALTFIAYQAAGYSDITTGDSERGTLTEWFRKPFNFDTEEEHIATARDYGYCDACIQEALESDACGLALSESDQGFVYCETFDTLKAFNSALAEAEREDANEEIED